MATINQNVINLMNERFGAYTKYILLNRALPDVRDGLKPVQRRILYAMSQLNLFANQAYKKSARVVGDVIGKYHPHGDSSIYEALVRMAQDWKMQIPLVDMHGNKGSIDDDPAAAMRYTEVKLAPISNLLVDLLKHETVPFVANFDDSEVEPSVLPTFFCNLLINGAKGIASGFATEIAPHNLHEVYDALIHLIKKPQVHLKTLATIMPAPDFPTGGQIIIDQPTWLKILESGQGKISVRAQATITNKQIIIEAIPYQVVKAKLVEQIETLAIQSDIGIKAINDHSDRHGIKIVIDLHDNAISANVWNFLLTKTECQINFHYNSVVIANNQPQQLGLKAILEHYLAFVKAIYTKQLEFELAKAKKRLEIVKGLIQAHLISDRVIKVIRQTSGGKQAVINNLVTQLKFSPVQAQAISELMLYRLGKSDLSVYQNEANELADLIKSHQSLLDKPDLFAKSLINQFQTIKKRFGTLRKSQLISPEALVVPTTNQLVKPSEIVVGLSTKGMIKRISPSAWKGDLTKYGLNQGDTIFKIFHATTNDHLAVFFTNGTYGLIDLHQLPISLQHGVGNNIETYLKDYGYHQITGALIIKNRDYQALNNYLLITTARGYGKLVQATNLKASRTDRLLKAIKLHTNDTVTNVLNVDQLNRSLLILTKQQITLRIDVNAVCQQSLIGAGATLIKLKPNDHVLATFVGSSKKPFQLVDKKQQQITIPSLGQIPKANRATRGSNHFLKSLNHKQPFINLKNHS